MEDNISNKSNVILEQNNIEAEKNSHFEPQEELKKLELNKLAQDPRVKSILKQIFEKIARQKKYKRDSKEMMLELKQQLQHLLDDMKKNINQSDNSKQEVNKQEEKQEKNTTNIEDFGNETTNLNNENNTSNN